MVRRPQRHPQTSFRQIGDEGGLVVLPTQAEVKVINPVAVLVYRLLDGTHTVDEIVAEVLEEFEVEPDVARRDVESFLEELAAHGMLAPEPQEIQT